MNEGLIGDAVEKLAHAVTPLDAAAGRDDFGGRIASLTEAVMSVSKSLYAIALAIDNLAEVTANAKGGAR
jgi:hypothetical protein